MEYRLTVQHNKNDNEQSVTIINDREDAKTEYLKSCEKDYFTQLEQCRCGEWERIMFQIEQVNMVKELDYVVNYVLN